MAQQTGAADRGGHGTYLSLFSRTSNVRDRARAHVLKRFEGEKASFLVQLNTTIGLEPMDIAGNPKGREECDCT